MITLEGGAVDRTRRSGRSDCSPADGVAILSLYGVAHIIVDAICASIVIGISSAHAVPAETFVAIVVLYHALAFGLQAIFGLVVDRMGAPRLAAAAGCLLTAAALLMTSFPTWAVVAAGIGNAAFHVGGGVIALRLTPHRATAPGLFVAPGSLGLLLGVILGKTGHTASLPLLPIALLLCLLICIVRVPRANVLATEGKLPNRGELILGCILLAIAIRSLLGFLVSFPWDTQPMLLLVLTVASILGKAAGGILADRWGWIRVGVGATLAALPLLALAATHPAVAIPGILLLNLAMPVTLAATSEAMPGHPGFAFGLTCLALLLGMLPSLFGVPVNNSAVVCLAILVSTAVLYRGLRVLGGDDFFRRTLEVQV